jgi:hypothetical protein
MTVYDFKNFKKASPFTKRVKRIKVTAQGGLMVGAGVGLAAAFNQAYRNNGGMSLGTLVDTAYHGMFMGVIGGVMGHFIGGAIEHGPKRR